MAEISCRFPGQYRSYQPPNLFDTVKGPSRPCCGFPRILSSQTVSRTLYPRRLLHNGRAPLPRADGTSTYFWSSQATDTTSIVHFSKIRTIFAIPFFRALHKIAFPFVQIPAIEK